ncbi:hypothetical protein M422DRAFT_40137 [Sphaerobolus stellatus SS14]|nr:hypothetical protein M422DRAFT_40137 [Sphaerobolus stellatus SS14]
MATPSAPSNRASLLAGLRTGGVRSVSQPHQLPHTAAPTGSFHIPRYVSANHSANYFPEEDDEDDELAELAAQNLNIHHNPRHGGIPMTAGAADGAMMYQQQQQQLLLRQFAAQRAATGSGMYPDQAEMQAQMMQMELLKFQAIQQAQQAQQYQAELYAQAQRQQSSVHGNLRRIEPVTAAPNITTFDQRVNAAPQLRARAQQAEYRAAMVNNGEDYGQVPMTAAISGKFASRGLNPHANAFVAGGFGQPEQQADIFMQNNFMNVPLTPGRTTVISGGTSLGSPNGSVTQAVSKSDAAVSWRRAGNNSVLRSATSPLNTRLTRSSPSNDESSPTTKARPQPLRFNSIDSMTIPTVTIDTSNVDEDTSSSSSKGGSPTSASGPATPPSTDTSLVVEPKKSYEGLGIGRQAPAAPAPRHVSMPLRQPKGPPSGADELGPRNFATRLRKQAIGGLGALVNARERREVAVEVQAF